MKSADTPFMVYADRAGNIYDHPDLLMAANSGPNLDLLPQKTDLIPLPPCSRLYYIPDSRAIGFDEKRQRFTSYNGYAVSAFLPPAYLRLYLPAYKRSAPAPLPLYAYTAIGFMNGEFVTPALKIDDDSKWRPDLYDYTDSFNTRVDSYLKRFPDNRLYKQLARCATVYHCTAAKNVFYPRWECPIPTSPACNSRCVGCISLQPSECCPSPQERMPFTPTADEIAGVALHHGEFAEAPLVSFGQGCEGDPVLRADEIAEAIKLIRGENKELTVNFNSNASLPEGIRKIAEAGADSVRVSLNSVVEETYNAYYRPRQYTFKDVGESLKVAKEHGLYTALNLLTMPGITDRKREAQAMGEFIERYDIDLVEMRNLNIDRELLYKYVKPERDELLGIKNLFKFWKKHKKDLQFGYFNRVRGEFFRS